MNPFRLAKQIKKTFEPNIDIYQLIKHYGIILLEVDSKDFIAGYRYIKRNKVIQVNQNLDDNLKRCVLWHEVGHALMHRTVNCYYMANRTRLRTMQYEVEAEQFAAAMLLPENIEEEMENKTIQEIAAYYGVTVNLVEIKWGK